MSEQGSSRARRLWQALEPIHAVTYFAPEPQAACQELGTRGFWMSYFPQRAAPLGAASAELVTALFYSFHPGLVARVLPAVWDLAPPERFLDLRLDAVDAALRRLLGPELIASNGLAEAADIARAAAISAPIAGCALAAANRALDWPELPHLVLWHAQTVLREHRGDGHVAALLTAGLDPVETLVVFAAHNDLGMDWLRIRRGWSEPEWAAAIDRLTARGLLDGARLTEAGKQVRANVEAQTDELAHAPWAAIDDARVERLIALAEPLVAAIIAGGGFLAENPMGLRPLTAAC